MLLAELQTLLEPHGLLLQGGLDMDGRSLLLVGNAGSGMWPALTASPEYRDDQADPLDRWCLRIGRELAAALGVEVIFPFEGPPYPPFLDWAARAGVAFKSPVSMFVHPEYGLWHAFRFALVLEEPLQGVVENSFQSPCVSCIDQPCLQACPVDAFDADGYSVDDCIDYLGQDTNSACRTSGCAARRACPVGREYTYHSQHAQFHMNAFLAVHVPGTTTDSG